MIYRGGNVTLHPIWSALQLSQPVADTNCSVAFKATNVTLHPVGITFSLPLRSNRLEAVT